MTEEQPALRADAVGLTIDGVRILTEVSLAAGKGELLALIGPNGAGKTSLINVLSGTVRPTSGRVWLHDRDVTREPLHRRSRAGLGRTFQTSNLLSGRTVEENVRLAVAARRGRSSLLRTPARNRRDHGTVAGLLEQTGLAGRRRSLASALSHGDRRKLELAVVLGLESSVVLLDEPMAGVNSDDVGSLVELIRKLHRESGITVLMVEHHMHVVLELADRIAVLHHGTLLATGTPDEVMADQMVQTAYLGEDL